ncbi:hypothetical protein ALC53_07246 [Atta colombica]|uniref:Uncharacterized protein n=1 Tax=Atta colombica TaxID=520822 RepID=A0A195BCF6_9HYME|nr:hypothetical protein ALC53_07246 [Atta colombica]
MTGPSSFLKTIHHSLRLLALVGVAPRSPERLKCRQQQLEGPLPASRFLWREIEEIDQVGMEIGRAARRDRWREKRRRTLLEASIGRGRPSCWELLAAVPPGDKPLPATELP